MALTALEIFIYERDISARFNQQVRKGTYKVREGTRLFLQEVDLFNLAILAEVGLDLLMCKGLEVINL